MTIVAAAANKVRFMKTSLNSSFEINSDEWIVPGVSAQRHVTAFRVPPRERPRWGPFRTSGPHGPDGVIVLRHAAFLKNSGRIWNSGGIYEQAVVKTGTGFFRGRELRVSGTFFAGGRVHSCSTD